MVVFMNTINEIAKRLNNCANGVCIDCEYCCGNIKLCQANLIRDMANECRRIVAESEDDGK